MFSKLKENVPGLSMIGLAITAMLFDIQRAVDLPIWADTLISSIEKIVLFMGVRDLVDVKKTGVLKRIVDFKSKTFWGILASSNVTSFLFNAEMLPGIGVEIQATLSLVGAVLIGVGIMEAGKRGKTFN